MTDPDAFRDEVRAWLELSAPAALRGRVGDPDAIVWGGRRASFPIAESKRWLDVASERGFTAPTWPVEYGGAGLDRARAKVLAEEVARLRLPPPLYGFGLSMIGPTLLQYGSEPLKREHLPRIARGEIRWAQGYSEPNAGSDLASLATRAVRDGEEFVLDGQKVWTSYGNLSDWMFALVRTDPSAKKQSGITFLLLDLDSPGVSVRPIRLISGASPFCETFFNGVRVPVSNVVGEQNDGWTVAKALLGHERNMIGSLFGAGRASKTTDRVIEVARESMGHEGGVLADPVARDRVAQLLMDQKAFDLTVKRVADAARAGQQPGAESSIFKVYGTELNQRRYELLMSLRGPESIGWEGEAFTADARAETREWLRSRGNTIEGGTSEIQLNIIAKRVLGLPD